VNSASIITLAELIIRNAEIILMIAEIISWIAEMIIRKAEMIIMPKICFACNSLEMIMEKPGMKIKGIVIIS
jgi:hypothetical protein